MDVELKETGNGGDLIEKPRDLSVIYGFQNMVYLGLFGGNVIASTPTKRIESQQAFDFWANDLLMKDDPSTQFNSETERALSQVSMNSNGRLRIEDAVKKDLKFMQPFAKVSVRVSFLGLDKISILILIVKPDNVQKTEFIYIWDSANNELIDSSIVIPERVDPSGFRIFDFSFSSEFE